MASRSPNVDSCKNVILRLFIWKLLAAGYPARPPMNGDLDFRMTRT